jgi:hypothetical protein
LVSQSNIIRFSKTSVFGITVAVFTLFRKDNITTIGILAASTRGHFGTHAVYAKGKFNLFRMFAGTLGGYNRKEGGYGVSAIFPI